jgi:hypothetical protein
VVNRDKADPEGAEGRLGLAPIVRNFGVLLLHTTRMPHPSGMPDSMLAIARFQTTL